MFYAFIQRPTAKVIAGRSVRRTTWLTMLALAASINSQAIAQQMPALRSPLVLRDPGVQRVEGFDEQKKPLPPEISAMPDVEEEMEVIQRRSQLILTKNNVTRTAISDPSIIDLVQFSPNEFALIGLALGSTTLTIWFEGSPDPLIYTIKTIRDPSLEDRRRADYGKLERKLHALFPNSKVYLIPLSTKIIVKGQARDGEEASRILQIVRGEIINQEGGLFGPNSLANDAGNGIGPGGPGTNPWNNGYNDFWSSFIVNMLDVPGEYQIMLRVRIAELSRSQLRQLGINFEQLLNDGRHAIGYSLGGIPSTINGIFENGEINILINWLASNGTVKIMSEPTLTVLSGHSASFLSGGEFAVPTIVGINGVGGQQTTFRGFGTSIIVTPMIVDRDLIRMRIVPEYSEINSQNTVGGIPGLDSRRVQTTVELREGQTIVLAGLFAHRSDVEVTRIPLLGDIPWVGPKLFSAKRATQDEKELLVTVSPEIVRPMDADEVPPYPGFYVTHPDDCQLYYHAMTEGPPDKEVYQLAPFGRGNGSGLPVGYRLFEPAPAAANITPQPGPMGGMPPNSPYMGQGPYRPPAAMNPPDPNNYNYGQPTPNGRMNGNGGYGPPAQLSPVPRSGRRSPTPNGPSAQYGPYPGQPGFRSSQGVDGQIIPSGYNGPTAGPAAGQGTGPNGYVAPSGYSEEAGYPPAGSEQPAAGKKPWYSLKK